MSDEPETSHPDVSVLNADKDWAMGTLGALLIVVCRGTLTEAAVNQINTRLLELTQGRPAACGYICVIEKSSPPPKGPVRRLAIDGVSRLGKNLACTAAVVEGNDFRSTLVRAILTGNAMVRPPAQPSKYFKNTHEMSVWIEQRVAKASADDIVHAVEMIRQRMPKPG